MQKRESNCSELIEKTADSLSDETLKLLFVSVQQNNLKLCVKYAVPKWALKQKKVEQNLIMVYVNMAMEQNNAKGGNKILLNVKRTELNICG